MSHSLLSKLSTLRNIIKQNGGVVNSILTLYRTDELKDGTLVGVDRNGNKYYENKRYFVGRSRWIIYADKYGLDYDGSQVDPEWHPWLHYMQDEPPTIKKPVKRPWIIDPIENKTGTAQQYVPYSTVKPKIEAWQPPTAPTTTTKQQN